MDIELEHDNVSNSSDCYVHQFDEVVFKIISGIRLFSALVSLSSAVCVIFVIFAYKKFKFYPQRLVLFLAIAVVLRSFSYMMGRLDFEKQRTLIFSYCLYFGGFFDLYTAWVELLALFCITVNIFCSVILCLDLSNVRYTPLIITLTIPLLWSWIPYTVSGFGTQGPWCGIRIHTKTCEFYSRGNWLRFTLWDLPLFSIFLTGFVVIIVAIGGKIQRKRKEWEGHRYDPQKQEAKQKVLKSICPLLCFPLLYLLFLTPRLAGDIYQSFFEGEVVRGLAIWILEAALTPLAGGIMVLAYTFDSYTRKTVKAKNLREICTVCFYSCLCKCLCKQKDKTVHDYHCEMESRFGDSVSGEQMRHTMYTLQRMSAITEEPLRLENPTFDII